MSEILRLGLQPNTCILEVSGRVAELLFCQA